MFVMVQLLKYAEKCIKMSSGFYLDTTVYPKIISKFQDGCA